MSFSFQTPENERAKNATNKDLREGAISSNSEAHSSFRQTQVDEVKIETGSEIKTVTIMQTKDGRASIRSVILKALKNNNIDTTTTTISSLQTIDGPKYIQCTVVLEDNSGNPSKQVHSM
jgi:hypothetical protein